MNPYVKCYAFQIGPVTKRKRWWQKVLRRGKP